jgi:Fe-S cluster biogenesis protein NfuA
MTIEERIHASLDSIRPYLQQDGGDVAFVRMRDDGVLELYWMGTCRVCPMSQMTLRAGVERKLMKEVPEVRRVETVAAPVG